MNRQLIEYVPDPFRLHSGGLSNFKLECDALSEEDCRAAALWMRPSLGSFGSVEAVPSTSKVPGWLADALHPFVTEGAKAVLICDDVLTTGASMEAQRAGRLGVGVVIFARGRTPSWIHALLSLNSRCRML